MTIFTEEYRPVPSSDRVERVAVTPRPILISELVLLLLARSEHKDGITPEQIHLIFKRDGLPEHIHNDSLNSVYASMSGMMTSPRQWIEPVTTRRGRNVPYRITKTFVIFVMNHLG